MMQIPGVPKIVPVGTPLQITHGIVRLVLVLMVDNRQTVRIREKRLSHQPVDGKHPSRPVFVKLNLSIATGMMLQIEIVGVTLILPVQAPDITLIADLV